MTLTPGSRLVLYEVLGLLGSGGMGEVYRARDPRLSREVAVKVLPASLSADPDRMRRFEQEAPPGGWPAPALRPLTDAREAWMLATQQPPP